MKYFIANWKQNFTVQEAKSWLQNFKFQKKDDCEVVLSIPSSFLGLSSVQETRPNIKLAAQNVSKFTSGQHTGQIGAMQIQGLIDYCLVGHPDVRDQLGDTSKDIASKAKNLLDSKITPVICITDSVLDEQITHLKHELLDLSGIIIAYEPVGAVGTGKPLLPQRVNEMLFKIKNLTNKAGPVIYGGSVNSDTVSNYLNQEYIDGLLIGKASLNPADFAKIVSCDPTS